jgi:histidinol-phosphate aminotransferase
MTVTFAEKLARIPAYEPGTSLDDAKAQAETADAIKLASNESPFPPHPAVIDAIAKAAADVNRYPDPDARALRRAIADRHDTDPARIAVSNGSCEILLAAALALCEQGDEILYAWPSFSIYPYLPALSGAREIRVPLTDDYLHDLDAMREELTAATQLLIVCNPNNPTGTYLPAERIGAFVESVPDRVTVILDEA